MKDNSGLKKIVNNVLVILFLSAMGGMVYFSQTKPLMSVFIVGAIFFFIGTLGIFTNGLKLENGFLLIFPFAGAVVMLISASFIWDFSFLEKIRKNILSRPIVRTQTEKSQKRTGISPDSPNCMCNLCSKNA